jgi:hypothetical protein
MKTTTIETIMVLEMSFILDMHIRYKNTPKMVTYSPWVLRN